MTAAPSTEQAPEVVTPNFHGAAAALMAAADTEVCMDGPAGTGKSYAALWKMHLRRILFPGSRGLLARKTLISLKSSTLVTYREQVLGELLKRDYVKFWAAKGDEPAHYAYWNGSKEVIVGLDKPGKAMSTEYDDVLVDEALDTEEGDIEALLTRIQRPGHIYGVEGRPPFAQLMLVTNPGPPLHWLNQRMLAGRTRRLISRHEDNPAMTPEYLALLANSLTGVRRERLLLGHWAAAEGIIYEDWNSAIHLIDRFPVPREWPRYVVLDFGFTNPFVAQWYALDPDGRLYLYREYVQTQRTVDQHAAEVLRLAQPDPLPRMVIADPEDADGRAVFTRETRWPTIAAHKEITSGIQAVMARLRLAGDGKPRLFAFRDCLVHRDPAMVAAKKPIGLAEEIDGYVWDTRNNRKQGEEPMPGDDHSLDAARYMVAQLDLARTGVTYAPSLY